MFVFLYELTIIILLFVVSIKDIYLNTSVPAAWRKSFQGLAIEQSVILKIVKNCAESFLFSSSCQVMGMAIGAFSSARTA